MHSFSLLQYALEWSRGFGVPLFLFLEGKFVGGHDSPRGDSKKKKSQSHLKLALENVRPGPIVFL